MKPRWLRHMIATPSPGRMPCAANELRERVGAAVDLAVAERAELVDHGRLVRGARGGDGDRAGGGRAPAQQRAAARARGGRARRGDQAGVDERLGDAGVMEDAIGRSGHGRYPSMNANGDVPVAVTRRHLLRSRQLEARRQLAALDERVDLGGPARIQAHVALVDARLLDEQAGVHEPLADRQRERAVVAGEAAREMGDLGVVAAPLPHPISRWSMRRATRSDGSGSSCGRATSAVGSSTVRTASSCSLDRARVGRAAAEAGDGLGDPQRVQLADRQAQLADVAERERRDRIGARLQAIDVGDRLLERLDRQLDGDEHVVGRDRERERQPTLPLARVQLQVLRGAGRHRGGAFDERADEHGDERPGAVVGGVRVDAQRRVDGRDREQRLAEGGERRPAPACRSPSAAAPARARPPPAPSSSSARICAARSRGARRPPASASTLPRRVVGGSFEAWMAMRGRAGRALEPYEIAVRS